MYRLCQPVPTPGVWQCLAASRNAGPSGQFRSARSRAAKRSNISRTETWLTRPRESIEALVRLGDLDALLRKAGELHGHFCPYLALGVRAAYVALRELGVVHHLGLEEVIATVETDGCFSDGIQMVAGCTFANNALVFNDLGKAAVTLSRRRGVAVRVAVRGEYTDGFSQRFPQAVTLLERIVVLGKAAKPTDRSRLMMVWAQTAFMQLDVPEEEVFQVQLMSAAPPPYAPLFASVRCHACGESVTENRIRIKDGVPVCLACAGEGSSITDGAGICPWKVSTPHAVPGER